MVNAKEKEPIKATAASIGLEVDDAISKEELEEILKKVDREAGARKLTGIPHGIIYVIGVGWSVFQVYTAAFGLFPAQLQRSIHLAFAFALTFLL